MYEIAVWSIYCQLPRYLSLTSLQVVNGTINLTFSRKLLWLYDSEHVPPVICEFRGCYEEWSDGMYEAFLMEDIPSCYIGVMIGGGMGNERKKRGNELFAWSGLGGDPPPPS